MRIDDDGNFVLTPREAVVVWGHLQEAMWRRMLGTQGHALHLAMSRHIQQHVDEIRRATVLSVDQAADLRAATRRALNMQIREQMAEEMLRRGHDAVVVVPDDAQQEEAEDVVDDA